MFDKHFAIHKQARRTWLCSTRTTELFQYTPSFYDYLQRGCVNGIYGLVNTFSTIGWKDSKVVQYHAGQEVLHITKLHLPIIVVHQVVVCTSIHWACIQAGFYRGIHLKAKEILRVPLPFKPLWAVLPKQTITWSMGRAPHPLKFHRSHCK